MNAEATAGPSAGLYVHFPWCVRKCPYCDFNSHPLKTTLREQEYVAALQGDLAAELERFDDRAIATVYFGGGTPSLFAPATFRTLLGELPAMPVEVTLEANPGAVEHGSFHAYRDAGITRVSLGAQSFEPRQLERLGRIHSPDETRAAARAVADAGFESFNIDLMYGLPEQTIAAALADLEQAVRLAPAHISWYQLTVEPKTEFARRPPRGLPSADAAAATEDAGVDFLTRHGYLRYEISAFARDGQVCAHNLNYWRFGDYLGIGAGAHGKTTVDGYVWRHAKPSQPRRYLAASADKSTPLGVSSPVAGDELAAEFLMNALRLKDGVEHDLFRLRTGLALDVIADTMRELASWGLMRTDRLALTADGYRQLDGILARFL